MHLNQWNQKGKVYLWRYEGNPKNYSGWHLHCDKAGASSLAELISALTHLDSRFHRTVNLTQPTHQQLGVPNSSAKAISDTKMVVSKDDVWSIKSEGGKTHFRFDDENMPMLLQAILGIPESKGDFSIGTKGSRLWFWW